MTIAGFRVVYFVAEIVVVGVKTGFGSLVAGKLAGWLDVAAVALFVVVVFAD